VDSKDLTKLGKLIEALKSTPRTGWMLRGVPAAIAESISEHMNEAALLALLLGEKMVQKGVKIDVYYAAAIASSHDVSEAIVGDLVKVVTDLIGKQLKESIEIHALEKYIDNTIITRLVREYIEQKSIEAKLAKLAEQLATLMQGLRYYKQGYDVSEIICSMTNSIEKAVREEPLSLLYSELRDIINSSKKICNKESITEVSQA